MEEIDDNQIRINSIRKKLGCGKQCAIKLHEKYSLNSDLDKFYLVLDNMSRSSKVFVTTGMGDICECYLKIEI